MSDVPSAEQPPLKSERPGSFEKDVIDLAQTYDAAMAIIEAHEAVHSVGTQAAAVEAVQDTDAYTFLTDRLGAAITNVTVTPIGGEVPSEEDYQGAMQNKETTVLLLLQYIGDYQAVAQAGLAQAYGEDDMDEVIADSWTATWSKLRDSLHPVGGTTLAEIADLLDGLLYFLYKADYDPSDRLRGQSAQADPAARAFYTVMEPHLKRQIVKHPDNWTGGPITDL